MKNVMPNPLRLDQDSRVVRRLRWKAGWAVACLLGACVALGLWGRPALTLAWTPAPTSASTPAELDAATAVYAPHAFQVPHRVGALTVPDKAHQPAPLEAETTHEASRVPDFVPDFDPEFDPDGDPELPFYYTDTLIVEFAPEYRVRLRDGVFVDLDGIADPRELARLDALGRWTRAHSIDEAEIDRLRAQAEARTEARAATRMPDLNNYFHFILPEGWDLERGLDVLRQSPLFSYVDRIPIPRVPQISAVTGDPLPNYVNPPAPGDGPLYQRYLDPAPNGIDARWAWLGQGGKGQGVRVCNLEYGYNWNHVDLPLITIVGPPIPGFDEDHGTAVMGILGAPDNGFGVTGIVHNAQFYFAYVGRNSTLQQVHQATINDAMLRCLSVLNYGDIMLVEQQVRGPNAPLEPLFPNDHSGLVAVDWYKPAYDVAKIAAPHVLVVEAAGNGRQWLDSPEYMTESDHNPFHLSTRSGALIAGSGFSPWTATPRMAFTSTNAIGMTSGTNYGSIVRMQGWGHHIVAPGYGIIYPGAPITPTFTNEFYTSFGGTSGGAPIVAGAAAAIQGVHKAVFGHPMSPSQLEELLRATGTSQTGLNQVGPLPDIRAAVEKMFADAGVGIGVPAPPVFAPGGGDTHTLPLSVYVQYGEANQNQHNTLIRVTADGSEPTFEHGSQVVPEDDWSWLVSWPVTLRAKAFVYDTPTKRWYPSETTIATYAGTTQFVNHLQIHLPGHGPEFLSPLEVSITTATPGANIYYRLDGGNINALNIMSGVAMPYTGPFTLGPGTYTIVARAYKQGYNTTINLKRGPIQVIGPILQSPQISPAGGSFHDGVEVSMSHSVEGAEIRYTINNATVTSNNSMLYTGPFWLDQSIQVRARAYLDGYQASPQTTVNFDIIQPEPPVIDPAGGVFFGSVLVNIEKPAQATTVRYTTNGGEPTHASPLYQGPFTLGIGKHQIKAKAFYSNLQPSAAAVANFTVHDPSIHAVAPPLIEPFGGAFTNRVTLSMFTPTEGATIRYTFDPDAREDTWIVYNGPFALTMTEGTYKDYTLRARAYKRDLKTSPLVDAEFRVYAAQGTVGPPWINPPGGGYTNTIQVIMNIARNAPTTEAKIHYTTDGTEPVGTLASEGHDPLVGFQLARPTHVRAIGAQPGFYHSQEVSALYYFYCDAPELPPSGEYHHPFAFTVSSGTAGAAIHYTLDGSTPTQRSPRYEDRAIELGLGLNHVRVRCFRRYFEPSIVIDRYYHVTLPPARPQFQTQPRAQSVKSGQSVLFQAELVGVDARETRYQWQLNERNIVGATEPFLEIPVATLGFAGSYRLLATTPGGLVISEAAELAVADDSISRLRAGNDGPTLLGQPTALFATVTTGTNVEYSWDFGDASVGSGPSPTHTYAALGSYTATVTARNGILKVSATTRVEITTTVAPIVGLAAHSSSPTELGDSTHFSATVEAGTGITYTWDFGDNNFGVGVAPSHVYTQTGVYTATVTASNAAAAAQASTVVAVGRRSLAISGLAASNSGPTQLGEPTVFTARIVGGTNVTFEWDFDDGNTGRGATPTHVYREPGTYTVAVRAHNELGSHDAQTVVQVYSGDLPMGPLTVKSTAPTELGEETRFSASGGGSGVTYRWEFGDGSTAQGPDVSHTYGRPGVYPVRVTASNRAGEQVADLEVEVIQTLESIQEPDFEASTTTRAGHSITFHATVATGTEVTYLWDFGDNNTGTGAVVNHTYTSPGDYLVRLTVRNDLDEITIERTVTVSSTAGEELPADEDPDQEEPEEEDPEAGAGSRIFLPMLQR